MSNEQQLIDKFDLSRIEVLRYVLDNDHNHIIMRARELVHWSAQVELALMMQNRGSEVQAREHMQNCIELLVDAVCDAKSYLIWPQDEIEDL